MFTGIIEAIGTVKAARPGAAGMRLSVDLGELAKGAGPGDSVAVDGVCLTVTAIAKTVADFDVSGETLSKSTLSQLKIGNKINAELAMQATGRFGGHIVQGHVDARGKIKSIKKNGDFYNLIFSADKNIIADLVPKGSVAIDGVSLTIADIEPEAFAVAIIPATWKNTKFNLAKIGDAVNIEIDILSKMISRHLEKILPAQSGLTVNKLKEMGF